MKVKYRLVIEVESDTDFEDTPDRWDLAELMNAPAELISYEELGEIPDKRKKERKIGNGSSLDF